MNDHISKSALLKDIEESVVVSGRGNYCGEMRGVRKVIDRIESAPTVDAVEVVRCKDCKHWLKDVAGCTDGVGRCEWANYMVGAVGYCVYGERRSDEHT